MKTHLRVLIVEDSEDDTLLTLKELRRGGYILTYVRVETAVEMQAALDQQPWDFVIADYSMPTFSAPEALKLLQRRQLDLPFIIVSGTIGEETAVAAMKAGAHDYLIKGNLTRLVPAVERELRDAKERQKRYSAEQALRESEDRFRTLCSCAPLAIFQTDAQGQHTYNNPLWYDISGQSAPDSGYGWDRAIHPEDRAEVLEDWQRTVSEQRSWVNEHRLLTPQGEVRWVRVLASPIYSSQGQFQGHVGTIEDITEKKQLEAQFLHAQRLENLGTLASGIAHDFNNILTPILAAAQLLPLKLPNLDENNQQLLKILEDSAKHGGDLVKQILSFTSGVSGSRTNVQVRHLLSDVAHIAHRTFPKSIETHTNIASDLWMVFADATQLHQVLMNLTVNARDAMPNGGSLKISAENFWIDQNYARMHVDAQEGPYILITIADSGTGIKPEIMERIFDPFFTTKELGKGTGLGLSTVMGIIKSHGGFVTVYSEVSKGSIFKVYLPSSEVNETQAAADAELPNGNGELILVVDDEVTICEITKNTLESHNYKVLTASDGAEALALYAQHKNDISVVLIDLMMPGIDGVTTILTLQRMNSLLRIIAMSGLMPNGATAQNNSLKIQGALSKPFTAEALLSTLHSVLHASQT
ncbi:hybrid sensor histidine kinase/response regulator [Iningainema tapete]|uniref:histidine kinase n=1 Tax=Iningainema tapete BLCC-T55 TaxID=2748662 RepID=A0A8J6XJX5_9CYAN|nr:response regulator [Iningainema tapete]MBD2774237.1 response regulator [Iningainema tapete BLCC-T55]